MSSKIYISAAATPRNLTAARRIAGADLPGRMRRLLAAAGFWFQRSRQRRALLELDDRMLRDIGLTRADVEREAAKPFWMC